MSKEAKFWAFMAFVMAFVIVCYVVMYRTCEPRMVWSTRLAGIDMEYCSAADTGRIRSGE